MSDTPKSTTPQGFISNWVHGPLSIVVRGVVASFSQIAPSDVLLAVCKGLGTVIGSMYGGPPDEVNRFRTACVDEFRTALKEAKIIEPTKNKSDGGTDGSRA